MYVNQRNLDFFGTFRWFTNIFVFLRQNISWLCSLEERKKSGFYSML